MTIQEEINQQFEAAYADGVKRITAMDHGLSDKSLAWVLDKEWALKAFLHSDMKRFNKTLFDWFSQALRLEQYATRKIQAVASAVPTNPYYPNDKSNRVGD